MAEVRREVDGSVLEMDVNRTSNTPSVHRQNAETGEWEEVERMKPPRHWPWLQRIVDWLWGVNR